MNVTLSAETEVTVVPATTMTVTEIKILTLVDSPEQQQLYVVVADADDEHNLQTAKVVLWEGEDYEKYADFAWTKSDVESQVKAVLAS